MRPPSSAGAGAAAAGGAAAADVAAAWVEAWLGVAPIAAAHCEWLRARRDGWGRATAKRVPAALYACERLQQQLRAAVRLPACAGGARSAALQSALAEPWHTGLERGGGAADEEGGEDDDAPALAPPPPHDDGGRRGGSRRRLRSRNPFIDAELAETGGNDTFADLEDFIVTKKGRSYGP